MGLTDVVHDEAGKEFYIDLPDEQRAYIRYYLQEGQQVDFHTTFVPDTHRGKGLAEILVNQAFDWAEQLQLKIKTSCWYAEKKLAQRKLQ